MIDGGPVAVAFFSAAVLLALSPRPDKVFVLMQSATHGRRAGLVVTLGLCTGLLGLTAAVALGLAAYGRGIVMNLTNPKVALFFLAFPPQFADPARDPVWLHILQLGALFMAATLVTSGSGVEFGDHPLADCQRARQPRGLEPEGARALPWAAGPASQKSGAGVRDTAGSRTASAPHPLHGLKCGGSAARRRAHRPWPQS